VEAGLALANEYLGLRVLRARRRYEWAPFHDPHVRPYAVKKSTRQGWTMDTYVERSETEVLRVRADMKGSGPAGAMRLLESRLPSLKGRKFYGAFRLLETGEEYFACVERVAGDDPTKMGLDVGVLPGGLYVRRKLIDWERIIAAGELGSHFEELIRTHAFDPSRPEIEYYRSMSELHVLLPVLSRDTPKS
jgi:hypothetical protein